MIAFRALGRLWRRLVAMFTAPLTCPHGTPGCPDSFICPACRADDAW